MSDFRMTKGRYGFFGVEDPVANGSPAVDSFVQAGMEVANLVVSATANKRARENAVKQAEDKLALLWEMAATNRERLLAKDQEELFYLQMEELERQEQLKNAKTVGFCVAGVMVGAMLMLLAKS